MARWISRRDRRYSPLATDPALVDTLVAVRSGIHAGAPETPRGRGAPGVGGDVAESIDRVRSPQDARVGRAAAPAEPPGPVTVAVGARSRR